MKTAIIAVISVVLGFAAGWSIAGPYKYREFRILSAEVMKALETDEKNDYRLNKNHLRTVESALRHIQNKEYELAIESLEFDRKFLRELVRIHEEHPEASK